MNINRKIIYPLLLAMMLTGAGQPAAQAQNTEKLDTFSCPIVGFSVGPVMPSTHFSQATGFEGTGVAPTMADLYKSPYLDFGLHFIYKTETNWTFAFDANIWFGNDNLQHRVDRMGSVYSRDSLVIGTNGTDANVTCYNRHLAFQGSVGKIIPLQPAQNPNSGILLKVGGGYQRGQTIFFLNDVDAPQVAADYALLYDHQRHGLMLTEAIGYWFMSNHANLINFSVAFEVSQLWSTSTRDYIIDNYAGLHGPDNSRYFDLLYSLKFTWMFPLKGKTARDYYYY